MHPFTFTAINDPFRLAQQLGSGYSERKESHQKLSARVNQAKI